MPSALQRAGEAEAEVERRRNEEDWLGKAALEGERMGGWVGSDAKLRARLEIHPMVGWRPPVSAAASARR